MNIFYLLQFSYTIDLISNLSINGYKIKKKYMYHLIKHVKLYTNI